MNKYDSLYTGLHNDGYEPRITSLTELSTTFTSLISILQASTTAISTTASYIRSSRVIKTGDTMTGSLNILSNDITLSVAPAEDVYGKSLRFLDNNGDTIGFIRPYSYPNGMQGLLISVNKEVNNVNKHNYFRLGIDNTGNNEIHISSDAKLAWRNALGLDDRVYCYVYYVASGDGSFSSWVPFNTIVEDTKNCFNTSNGQFTVPSDGYYLCNFGYYSNTTSVNTAHRPALGLLNADGTTKDFVMCTGNPSMSISHVWHCQAGEKLAAGTYDPSWTINFYRSKNHNYFSILKL